MFSKKAVIGTAFTWFAAMFIIIIILLLYLVGVIASIKTSGFSDREIIFEAKENELTLTRDLIIFLDKEIDYNGDKILIKDLLIGEDDDKFERFEEEAAKYLDEKYSSSFHSGRSLWMRVYKADDFVDPDFYKITFFMYVGNLPFSTLQSKFQSHYGPCLIDDPKSIVVNIFVLPDKKIVMCIPDKNAK